MLHEADRSIHDALCVIRCLVKNRAIIAGGGAPETELAVRLNKHARTLSGMDAYCFQVCFLFKVFSSLLFRILSCYRLCCVVGNPGI